MCLNTVSKRKPRETGFGWKMFDVRDGELYGEYYAPGMVRPIDKWLKEGDYKDPQGNMITFVPEPDYPAGWHIYKRKKDAENWAYLRLSVVVHKVEYRKAHTQGKQRVYLIWSNERPVFYNCVVAKEIKILPLKGKNNQLSGISGILKVKRRNRNARNRV